MMKIILIKTITWRLVSIFILFVISYSYTGEFITSVGIASIDSIIKTIAYFIHEYFWNER